MLARLLRRFEPFAALEWTTLCSVARHARLLRFAAQRTLSPNRRKHHGSCYLVKGVVRRRDKSGREQQIADQDAAARHALLVAGDGTSIETLGAVTLLWIDVDPVAFMLGADTAGYAVERGSMRRRTTTGCIAFSVPGLVECLDTERAAIGVSRVRSAGARQPVRPWCAKANRPICSTCSPTAPQRCGARDRRLAALMPGDSFGADALVSGQRRNASVVMAVGRTRDVSARRDVSRSGQRAARSMGRRGARRTCDRPVGASARSRWVARVGRASWIWRRRMYSTARPKAIARWRRFSRRSAACRAFARRGSKAS